MLCKVAVLMSTYNGTEYVKDQIDSIYRQTFRDFRLYIRDDGSAAVFVGQLKELQQKYGFELIEGENVGFEKSFMTLLEAVDDAQYYAFSDQDDIWLANKLELGVQWMEAQADKEIPLLYHGAYDIVNREKEVKGHFYFDNEGYDFRRTITENHYSGFSMLINNKLRDYMIVGDYEKLGYHDWWAAMIAHAFGRGFSSSEVTAQHILHEDNITTFNLKTRFSWLFRCLTQETDIQKRSKEFQRCFGDELSFDNRKILKYFCGEHYNIFHAVIKCFYPKRWRPVWSSELVTRFLMLVGRI